MFRTLLFIFLCLLGSYVFGQSDSIKPKWTLTAIGLKAGAEINIKDEGTNLNQTITFLNNCKHAAPNSQFNDKHFGTGYDTSHYNSFGNFSCNAFAELKMNSPTRSFFWELRGGLYFNSKRTESLSFREQDSIVVDTMMDSGYTYTTSTNYSNHYYYKFSGQNLGIEFTPLLNYSKWKSVTPFIGVSAAVCYSFSNKLTVLYNPHDKFYDRGEWLSTPLNVNTVKEVTHLKDNVSFYAGIPVGVSFKHSNKAKTFLLSPFFEARFGYKFEKYPSYKYTIIPFLNFQVGCKVNFRKKNKSKVIN